MTAANKIDSNATSMRIAEESSLKTLPGTPVWIPIEPNSYSDFGGSVTTVARNPINADRKRKKGVTTDLDASGGFNIDLTQANMQDLLQGFFFADLRRKGECKNGIGLTTITISVAETNSRFTRVGGSVDLSAQFSVGDLVFSAGFANSANNGLFKVSAVTTTTLDVILADGTEGAVTLVDESATSSGSLVQVGIEGDQGDIDVDTTGDRPALTSTFLDFTDLGLIEGEFIFVGGDQTATKFGTAANNGFARVRSIAANRLEFDKTQNTMATEANTTSLVQLFFGRLLKDETGSSIVRRSYNLERQLSKADDGDTYNQCEYVVGAIPNELTINVPTADKVNLDLTYVGMDHETKDGDTGPKSGTRPTLVEADAFNTSSDFKRIKMFVHDESDANPSALFAFASDITVTINNNVTPNKAIGTLGAFDATAGMFEVGGSMTAYFADVAALDAVRNNSDVTMDIHLAKNNAGISIDLPLITLGDGRLAVEQDQPVNIPLSNEAVSGASIDTDMNHTLMMVFFDYLPDLAEA